MHKEIKNLNLKNIADNIDINTVDAFQGRQTDIIIYSTVRSSKKNSSIGFQKERERLNVAFSRARRLLIIVGDLDFINNYAIRDNKFPDIIKYIKENKDYCQIIDC